MSTPPVDWAPWRERLVRVETQGEHHEAKLEQITAAMDRVTEQVTLLRLDLARQNRMWAILSTAGVIATTAAVQFFFRR